MTAEQAADVLDEIAALLELKGESPFKSRAYARAARTLRRMGGDLAEVVEAARKGEIAGIGAGIAARLEELLDKGRVEYLEELRAAFPEGVREMLRIPGLGPRKVATLYRELGVQSLGELEYACVENRLVELKGFGPKMQSKILDGLRRLLQYRTLYRLPEIMDAGNHACAALQKAGVRCVPTGAFRRFCETAAAAEVLAVGADAEEVASVLRQIGRARLKPGIAVPEDAPAAVVACRTRLGTPVRAYCAAESDGVWAWLCTTGASEHIAALRARAEARGFEWRANGLFRDGKQVELESEEEVYGLLGLACVPPELREGRGEIEDAQQEDAFRGLLTSADLRGILHVHSFWSDGLASIAELAEAVRAMGMSYLGITDHSRSAGYAGGLSAERVRAQHEEIDRLNEQFAPFRILKGIESDILPDGSLDYDEETLAAFDFVVASVHSSFGMSEEQMTERLVRAVENPFTAILGHPTGRLLLAREGYRVDLERVLEAAARTGTAVELNANPHRLDLDWRWHRRARELGVRIAICPDAHSLEGLEDTIRFGIGIARKGGLRRTDVVNCWSVEEAVAFFRRKRT